MQLLRGLGFFMDGAEAGDFTVTLVSGWAASHGLRVFDLLVEVNQKQTTWTQHDLVYGLPLGQDHGPIR